VPPPQAPAVIAEPVQEKITDTLSATEIEKGAFVVEHVFPRASANSMVVEMSPTELLVIDTPWTPAATEDLLKWMQAKFGDRKITVVNTHSHMDRVGGNEVFIAKGYPVYSSDMTIKFVNQNRASSIKNLVAETKDPAKKAEYKKMKLQPADHSFPLKEGKTLTFGDKTAEVFFPGGGHTKDNVVVYLPSQRILFGGCFIVGMPKLGYIKEADMKAWPKSLETLSRFDPKWVIPGHERNYSVDLIQHTKNLVK
jgi:metallo-beta-lactamase class B